MSFVEAHMGLGASISDVTHVDAGRLLPGAPASTAGKMVVYRTEQDVAKDLLRFGGEVKELTSQGGLKHYETAATYVAAKGRLSDLQDEVIRTEKTMKQLEAWIEMKVRELAKLGVMSVGDIAQKLGMMGVTKLVPGVGWILGGLEFLGVDIFGSKKKKKREAERLLKEIEGLTKQLKFWAGRYEKLNEEGQRLAKAFDKGPEALAIQSVGLAQKTQKTIMQADVDKDGVPLYSVTKKKVDVADKYMRVDSELAERAKLTPTGARLPTGFQQLYSPALANTSVVAKIETRESKGQAPQLVTGQKLVFGGLAGMDDWRIDGSIIAMWVSLAAGVWFAGMLSQQAPPPAIAKYRLVY